MPSVLIETRTNHGIEKEQKIMKVVHDALIFAFKIKPHDKNVRLIVHEPHRFNCPPDKLQPELYTHISIDAFTGRSLDAKRLLYKTIVENLEKLDIPKDHIKILIREISKENWGLRGGQAGCDIELGFIVEV